MFLVVSSGTCALPKTHYITHLDAGTVTLLVMKTLKAANDDDNKYIHQPGCATLPPHAFSYAHSDTLAHAHQRFRAESIAHPWQR